MPPAGHGDATAGARLRVGEVRPGMLLNRTYRILHPLASGGLGRVFVAAHQRLPGKVAVKVLHGSFLRDKDSLARFRNEAEILAGLNHPNVVRVLDYNVSEGGLPYLVMELLDGVELRACIGASAVHRRPAWVVGVVRQVAGALRAAHLRGIVHRDVKPENIMVLSLEREADFVKVLDFGVSNVSVRRRTRQPRRRARPSPAACRLDPSLVVGTPGYMAPEQLHADTVAVDDRADQFALAAVAWELLAGRPAFWAEDERALLWKVSHEDPPALGPLVTFPAGGVEKVLHRALAKRRDERYPDIQELARALEQAVTALATPAPAPASTVISSEQLEPLAPARAAAALDEFAGVGESYLW
jgi:eukaryotic-like serine/threonine-protein kinase